MNRILLVLAISFFLFFSHCTCHKYKKNALNIQVNVIEKLPSKKFIKIAGNFYTTKIDLFNNTDSTVSFWSATCSWEGNWVSNINGLYLYRDCENDWPVLEHLKSKEHHIYEAILRVPDSLKNNKVIEAKLGFMLVKSKLPSTAEDYLNETLLYNIKQQIDTIWSAPFKLSN